MDEITLDDKKYVSSKQAAKLTGYAKDYVGQLCREGRVQARLVGRSWYVLESSIKDHRFGTQQAHPVQDLTRPVEKRTVVPEPRAVWNDTQPDPERLPIWTTSLDNKPFNVGLESEEEAASVRYDARDNSEQEVPYEHRGNHQSAQSRKIELNNTDIDYEEESGEDLLPVVPVIWQQDRTAPPVHTRQMVHDELQTEQAKNQHATRRNSGIYASLRALLVLIGLVSAMVAYVNSGFADAFLTSANRASVITGVVRYKQ